MATEHGRTGGLGRVEPGRRSLTASEAAAIIGVSVATVRGWADDGRLPSHRTVGGHRRFDMDELREWLDQHGAPVPRRFSIRAARTEIPACPTLARELNNRSDAIIERVLGWYDPSVPTITQIPTEGEMRRAATRFVRVVTGALETGNPSAFSGRARWPATGADFRVSVAAASLWNTRASPSPCCARPRRRSTAATSRSHTPWRACSR